MAHNEDIRPIPETAEVVYDECLGDINSDDFRLAWFSIYRAAYRQLYRRKLAEDPNLISIVPYREEETLSTGVLVCGVSVDYDEFHIVGFTFQAEKHDDGHPSGVLTSTDTASFELMLSDSMTRHLQDLQERYERAITVGSVIAAEDRNQ